MNITAIIAEYNPFHNGHFYQIQTARQITDADIVLVIMSGDFVQRGDAACIDKYTRCRMALTCGADIVLELPGLGALGSAEIFAESAVSILNQLGCVQSLCFGCETDRLTDLYTIAHMLAFEPEDYQKELKEGLKQGLNYPAARSRALTLCTNTTDFAEIMNQPNNILAIEYLKALIRTNSCIQPVPVKRIGEGYHSTDYQQSFASATAIRKQLLKESNYSLLSMPEEAKIILSDYLSRRPLISINDFSDMLAYRLHDPSLVLSDYIDISDDLANRIDYFRYSFRNIEQFADLLVSKNMTNTRISRCLLHILLNQTKQQLYEWKKQSYTSYVNVLGFKKNASVFWKCIDSDISNSLITRPARAAFQLSDQAYLLYQADLTASRLYRQIQRTKNTEPIPDLLSEPLIVIS